MHIAPPIPVPCSRTVRLSCLGLVLALGACSVAPVYQRPDIATPTAFKEAGALWQPAAPADALDRGPWWTLFQDAELDRLAAQVQLSNQNIAVAVASYAQAQALMREQRAALFPSLGLAGGASRGGGAGRSTGSNGTALQAGLSADWAPDLWGRLGGAVDSASANAQASEADLASARLSAVGALVANYFQLREADAEIALLQATVAGYERSLQITQNRYAAGVIARTDVLQAQTQRASALADMEAARQSRAVFEHALAVLTGVAPADFSLPQAPWVGTVPAVPPGIPSTLLQRRPDIAAAERAVASANAQIGVQRAAYFPSLSLSASLGRSGTGVGGLFGASGAVWSLGLSVAQTLFDAGAIAARVQGAEAGRDAKVAQYRQTVLSAFQSVEDQLSALRTLRDQEPLRQEAVSAAELAAEQLLNRYRAGQVVYTDVVTAQETALSARRALLQLQLARQLAVASLVQALGGGWHAPWTPAPS